MRHPTRHPCETPHTRSARAYTREPCSPSRGVRSFRGADITPPTQPFPSFSFSCFFLFSLDACYAGGKEEGKEGGWRKEISASFGISDSNIPLAPYQDYYMNVCGSLKQDLSRKIDSNSSYIVLLFAPTITKRFVLNVFPSLDRSIDQFLRCFPSFRSTYLSTPFNSILKIFHPRNDAADLKDPACTEGTKEQKKGEIRIAE